MSSLDDDETGPKLRKIKLEPGQEMEVCIMLLECCSQEKIYLDYYGRLGQQFCKIKKVYQKNFGTCFVQYYSKIDRLETTKIWNVARFFAHLLAKDALPWHVLAYIRLTEEATTFFSRIFIKILFKELARRLGISQLNKRLSDPTKQADFESIFPRDDPKNTRYSINFFTCIGLGGITENLRKYLEMPRAIKQQKAVSDQSKNSDSSGLGSKKSSSIESKRKSESDQKPAFDQSKKSDSSRLRLKKLSSIESKRKSGSDQQSLIVQQKPASDQSKNSDSSSLGSKKSSSIESKRKSESDQKSGKRQRRR
uniref:pre-mRNA-splicing factor CWC22 homolog n=1 Tax=Erigeron canadensis TaxID=72917 RepID=UPI001CB93C87|nr:pre-mRNA-splicing factor CWC22 homolog [Erigeron canadensis]